MFLFVSWTVSLTEKVTWALTNCDGLYFLPLVVHINKITNTLISYENTRQGVSNDAGL